VVIEFIDPDKTGEYRMTTDPSEKAAYAAAPKAGATVQRMFPGGALVSVPLTAYGDHKVSVHVRMASNGQNLQAIEESVQGPASIYTKVLRLPAGPYHFEVVVKDLVTGKVAADTIEFEVK
jgi:hypothetical protein